MTLTPTEITNIALALSGLIAVLFVGIVNVITARKVTAVKETVAVIEAHVNSEKTAAQGRETSLVEQNRLLREVLEESKTAAKLLAQSAAQHTTHTTPSALAAAVTNGGPQDVRIVQPPLEPVPVATVKK